MNHSKTYVLLHGAWHGAWCWQRVVPLLQAAGHKVHTPTQTGVGERSHLLSREITLETFILDLTNELFFKDLHDVILVGHSFGGIAISGAADRMPERIRHLVYLDAMVLLDGQSPFSRVPPDVAQKRRELSVQTSGGLSIPVPTAEMLGVTDPKDAQWLMAKCTPHPVSTYEDAIHLAHEPGNGLPATYIAVTPHYGPVAASRDYAKSRSDWHYMEIAAGHDAMVTSPEALTKLLLSID
jgi:pimeloyl-ACP methyl ester carboxylesterase